MRKQRSIRRAGIAEEAVDLIKKSGEPIRTKTRGQIAPGKAVPQPVIPIAREITLPTAAGSKDTDISSKHERKGQARHAANDTK
jgi:hypothetical protein